MSSGTIALDSILESHTRNVRDWDWWNCFIQLNYYGSPGESGRWDAAERDLVADLNLQPGNRLLDLGSGSGELAFRLATHGLRVTALEICEPLVRECLREAANKGIPVSFVCQDMFGYAPSDRFDTILSLNTSFGYGSDEQNRGLIAQIAEWLAPGGRLYLNLVVADNATGFGVWSDDLSDGTLIVDNSWDAEQQMMISWPYWVPPEDDQIFTAPTPESVRLYSQDEIESMMKAAGLQPKVIGDGASRNLRRHRNAVVTWIATKPE